MDLRSGYPYWLLKNGLLYTYPSLSQNTHTQVAVLGGGVSGALAAYFLCMQGVDVVIVDRREAGLGSTCASTALLQYEIDVPLHKLAEEKGFEYAARCYQLCLEAIHTLHDIAEAMAFDVNFAYKPSLLYASFKKDAQLIEKEYTARKKAGIIVEKLTPKEIEERFPFTSSAALLSEVAAEVDPYKLTHALLQACLAKGAVVADQTEIEDISYGKNKITLTDTKKRTITCKHLLYASGYETQGYLTQPVTQLHSTYALVSEPYPTRNLWYKDCLIWETAQPYLYFRTTHDNRILIGGKDEPFYNPRKRDSLLKTKTKQLVSAYEKLFPNLPLEPAHSWCGTFGETKDGLPYIGTHKDHPGAYFSLGFGGNGITFSTIAAQLFADYVAGKKNKDSELFSFYR